MALFVRRDNIRWIPLRVYRSLTMKSVVNHSWTPNGCRCAHSDLRLGKGQIRTLLESGLFMVIVWENSIDLRLLGPFGWRLKVRNI